jgi:hypothetical protein
MQDGLERIGNETDGLKFLYLGASYKPFVAMFSMLAVGNVGSTACQSALMSTSRLTFDPSNAGQHPRLRLRRSL